VVITEQRHLDTILAAAEALDSIEQVVVVDGDAPAGAISLDELAARGRDDFDFEGAWRGVKPDDVLTLIYTSGTTGPPKGVQITHANICETVRSYDELIDFPDGGRIVSYLPMAHVAERNVSHYLPMLCGFTITCCPDAREVIAYLPEVRPTWFFAVPRIWEKLKAGLEQALAAAPEEEGSAAQQALGASLEKVRLEQRGEAVPDELAAGVAKADELIFSKLRERLGLDQVEACNVGAAPTPSEVIEFFHALGIPLSELWGMSETTGAGTCNPPERIRIGTIGPPAPGVEVKLAEDGEIMIKGPVVMKGYRNLPEKTAESFTDDGFLLTGDIGEWDEEGYLRIVDRKKELIITAAGKNLSPANIEARLKQVPLVSQAVAVGDTRKYISALLTLDAEAASAWARKNGIDADPATLASNEELIAEVQRGVDGANEELARVEQVKRFVILPADWEPGGDELTPTMKLKRKPIAEKYSAQIETLYDG
jgi:long-subunit acyl-CoA synthetase (AMP-forming)